MGQFELLNTVVPFSEECQATFGSRMLRLTCTAMDESLNAGCTIHVFRRLRGGAVQVDMELGLFLGNGNVRCAGPTKAGLHVPVVIGVLNPWAPSSTPSQVVLEHVSLWWFVVVVVVPPLWSLVGSSLAPWCPSPPPVPMLVFGPLGKAPAPKGGKAPPTARVTGFTSPAPGFKPPPPGSGVGFQPLGPSFSLLLGAKSPWPRFLALSLALPRLL